MRRVALTILLALAAAATAAAHHNGAPDVDHYVQGDGTGMLIANPGGHPLTWDRCPPDGPCERLAHTEPVLDTGEEPRGTVFVATQAGVATRSEPWQGTLRATVPPRLEGEPKVGELVRPLAATWEGGWGREDDWLQLQMCRTPEGADCFVLVDERKHRACEPGGGRYLPPTAVGRWLRVVDVRVGTEGGWSLEGYGFPEAIKPQEVTGPGVAAATFGPVRRGTPRPSGCPVTPRVQLGSIWLPQPVAGLVLCPGGCRIDVMVRQRGRTLRQRFRGQYVPLQLTAAHARRLRPGHARVRVRVDGRLRRERIVTVKAP